MHGSKPYSNSTLMGLVLTANCVCRAPLPKTPPCPRAQPQVRTDELASAPRDVTRAIASLLAEVLIVVAPPLPVLNACDDQVVKSLHTSHVNQYTTQLGDQSRTSIQSH